MTRVHTPGPGDEHPGAAGALAGTLLNLEKPESAEGLEATSTGVLSRAGARAGCIPGPPTSSSPAAPGGAGAPGGIAGAPALDASHRLGSGAKVPALGTGRHDGNAVLASGARDTVQPTSTPAEGPEMRGSSPRLPTTRWEPAFVDNDVRTVPTIRETVTVNGGVL